MDTVPLSPNPVRWGYWRPPVSGYEEGIAETKLAARLGWNLPVVRRQEAANASGGSGAYRLIAPAILAFTPGASVEVLRLADWKRFGNAIRQLQHLFYVAEKYDVKRIEFPAPHPFFQGSEVERFKLAWAPPVTLPAALQHLVPPRPGLVGDFFYVEGLGLQLTEDDRARMAATYLRPLLIPEMSDPHPDVRAADIVLHFRAGDIFARQGKQGVHRGYGQPPLAFYLAAVEREKASRVWIVFEDRGNPAVDAAEAALRSKGIEVRMQSADLKADLRILTSAGCLVAGTGTFCEGAAALSANLRKYYCFGSPPKWIQRLGIEVCAGTDIDGFYRSAAMASNWVASPEQIALMLRYPERAIAFAEHPPTN